MFRTGKDMRRLFELLPRADDGAEIELPRTMIDTIQGVVDLHDWEPHLKRSYDEDSANTNSQVLAAQVPQGTLRLVTQASIQDFRTVASDRCVWIEYAPAASLFLIAVCPALFVPSSITEVRHGTEKPFLMLPGDILIGHVDPPAGATDFIVLDQAFIDFPIGSPLSVPPVG